MTGRGIRIAILLLVLAFVGLDAWLTRSRATSWEKTLRVSVHPIPADQSPATRDYVSQLTREDFGAIEDFLAREARRHGVVLDEPARIGLRAPLAALPPLPPADRSLLGTMLWSLKLRWWAWRRESAQPSPPGHIRMFVLYYDPELSPRVAHSLGLKEGLIGIVHAFATRHMTQGNNFVIAHELLHTLGARDKYDLGTGLPSFPDGYAEPDRSPRYPQQRAELMGGRIARTPDHADIPEGLGEVVVGLGTAREIGWVRP
ncbi:MAG TPA: hypothetical protein VM240_09510 [Verrucomicrobiae bacterium]|nr:hypothetical protein [Verrucomicrobiae bacterium]